MRAHLPQRFSSHSIIQLLMPVMQGGESPQQPAELLRRETVHLTHGRLGNVVQQSSGPAVRIACVVCLGQSPNHVHHAASIQLLQARCSVSS